MNANNYSEKEMEERINALKIEDVKEYRIIFFRAKQACCLSKNDNIYTFCIKYDVKHCDTLSRKLAC